MVDNSVQRAVRPALPSLHAHRTCHVRSAEARHHRSEYRPAAFRFDWPGFRRSYSYSYTISLARSLAIRYQEPWRCPSLRCVYTQSIFSLVLIRHHAPDAAHKGWWSLVARLLQPMQSLGTVLSTAAVKAGRRLMGNPPVFTSLPSSPQDLGIQHPLVQGGMMWLVRLMAPPCQAGQLLMGRHDC